MGPAQAQLGQCTPSHTSKNSKSSPKGSVILLKSFFERFIIPFYDFFCCDFFTYTVLRLFYTVTFLYWAFLAWTFLPWTFLYWTLYRLFDSQCFTGLFKYGTFIRNKLQPSSSRDQPTAGTWVLNNVLKEAASTDFLPIFFTWIEPGPERHAKFVGK